MEVRRRWGIRRRASLPTWDQYAYRWTGMHGGIDPRRAQRHVQRWIFCGYLLAKMCARLGARPAAVTSFGLLAGVAVPWFAQRGGDGALVAAGLVIVTAVADTVDGALAVLTDRTTRMGYVYDAVADRLAEVFWLVALAHMGMKAWIGVVACGITWLHEYTRSRANTAGMTEIGGTTLGERPTRVVLTVLGLVLGGLLRGVNSDLPAGVATFAGAAWIVLSLLGFMQLFASVHRALAGRSWRPRPARTMPRGRDTAAAQGRRAPAGTAEFARNNGTGERTGGYGPGFVIARPTGAPSATALYMSAPAPPDGSDAPPDLAGFDQAGGGDGT